MRTASVFVKSLKENLRDWKILIMTLIFAPFFVLMMYLFYGDTSQVIRVTVCNLDQKTVLREGTVLDAGADLVARFEEYQVGETGRWLRLIKNDDEEAAKEQVKKGQSDLLLVIPRDFSAAVKQHREGLGKEPIVINIKGAVSNPRYLTAVALTYGFAGDCIMAQARIKPPLSINEEFLEKSSLRSDFDYLVPGILVLSVIMVLFTSGASIIREVDKKTIIRLRLSQLTSLEFLAGISLVQIIITEAAVLLTYGAARGLGYQPAGSMTGVLGIGLVSGLSLIAISLIVASFLDTIFDLMTIGCFPFFILMFFSGGMFPLPQVVLLRLGDRAINLTDILPTSHAIAALNKILNFGFGLSDVLFEVSSILFLTLVYFFLGVSLFKRRHLAAH